MPHTPYEASRRQARHQHIQRRLAPAVHPSAAGTQVKLPPAGQAPPADPPKDLVSYPFPIRPGLLAQISLPADLTKAEAKHLAAFVESLAMDSAEPQRALPASTRA